MKIKIAVVQMQIWDGEKERNLNFALKTLKSLSNSDGIPNIVCFPELFTTGYDLKNVKKYAEKIPGETIEKIIEVSRNKFSVLGTILEVENSKYYNTAFVITKKGEIIGKYQKTHLFAPLLEKEFLTPGNKITTFYLRELNDLKIGIAICYDLRFPEVFRIMALEGAQIIFIPSEFPSPKRKIWEILLQARAIENQVFVVGINRIGKDKAGEFFGYSLVTNGDYFEHMGEVPETRIFSIELDNLKSIRESLPVLKDRRDDLYGLK